MTSGSQRPPAAPAAPDDDLKPPRGTPERDAMTRVTIPLTEYRALVEAVRASQEKEAPPDRSLDIAVKRLARLVEASAEFDRFPDSNSACKKWRDAIAAGQSALGVLESGAARGSTGPGGENK